MSPGGYLSYYSVSVERELPYQLNFVCLGNSVDLASSTSIHSIKNKHSFLLVVATMEADRYTHDGSMPPCIWTRPLDHCRFTAASSFTVIQLRNTAQNRNTAQFPYLVAGGDEIATRVPPYTHHFCLSGYLSVIFSAQSFFFFMSFEVRTIRCASLVCAVKWLRRHFTVQVTY